MRGTLCNLRGGLMASLVPVSLLLMTGGCANPAPSRLNAPPQGQSQNQHPMQEDYVYMTDNALLEDMSISEVHFVPRTAELNALGVRRLIRMTKLLKTYGGTVFYDGSEPDKELRQSRTERIEGFLAASGLEPDQFTVEQGVAGGRGMDAPEAIDIREATRGPSANVAAGSTGGQSGGYSSPAGGAAGGT